MLQLGAAQSDLQVLGLVVDARDEGQVDLGAHGSGKLALGLLRSLLQPLEANGLLLQVDAIGGLEVIRQPVNDRRVKIIAAQMGVAVGGHDLAGALAQVQDGDIEGAATQVIDCDLLVLLLVHAVGQRGRGGLVDDPPDIHAGDTTGVTSSLTLTIVEVSGDRDDDVRDGLPQEGLGVLLQLLQNHGRDFRGSVGLVAHLDSRVPVGRGDDLEGNAGHVVLALVQAASHETLDGVDRAGGVGHGLTFGLLTHQTLAILGESDHGGSGSMPLRVGDDLRLGAVHDGHARICGAQVNTQHLSSDLFLIHKCTSYGKVVFLEIPRFKNRARRRARNVPETPRISRQKKGGGCDTVSHPPGHCDSRRPASLPACGCSLSLD